MLVNILQTFDDANGKRRYAGENPDVDPAIARRWIADGYAAADTDAKADGPLTTFRLSSEAAARNAVATAAGSAPVVPDSLHGYWSMAATQVDIAKGPLDLSGNGLTMALGAGLTAGNCWANSGYASTVAAVNGHLATGIQPNFATDFSYGTFVLNMATPGGLVFVNGANDYLSSQTGLSMGVAADGKLRAYLAANGVITSGSGIPTISGVPVVVADNTDHKIGWAWDPANRCLYVYVDGVLAISLQNAITPFASTSAGAWSQQFIFGVNKIGSAANVMKIKNVVLGYKTGGVMPSNIGAVMATYAATPQDIVPLFDANTRDLDWMPNGQSNALGYGGTGVGTNAGAGTPIQDPTYPNGAAGKRSLWPSFAQGVGAFKYKANILNYAVGSTGICDSWVGRVRGYATGTYVKLGSFCAQGGRIYKVTAATGNHNALQLTALGTLSNGATDGAVTWSDFGADTGFRGVASSGSPYFDPNGLVTTATSAWSTSPSKRKVAYIAWGETDANMSVSRADYAAAIVSLTRAHLAAGATGVMLGHTFGAPAYTSYYDTYLVPAVSDAAAAFSNDARVFLGGNLYKALGAMPTNPATGVGLLVDALHGNDNAYQVGGTCVANDLTKWLIAQSA